MKKIIALVLVVFAIASSICSCSFSKYKIHDIFCDIDLVLTARNTNIAYPQIVKNSQFQLGEEYETKEYGDSQTVKDYGTFPSIVNSYFSSGFTTCYAMQHLGVDFKTAYGINCASSERYAGIYDYDYTYYFSDKNGSNGNYLGYVMHNKGGTDIFLDISKSLKGESKKYAEKEVCKSAFVFMTSKDNPIDSITQEQVVSIFKGEITNWKALGGNDEKIKLFSREENSANYIYLRDFVLNGENPTDKYEKCHVKDDEIHSPNMVVVGRYEGYDVAEYVNSSASIGCCFKFAYDTYYKDNDVKMLKINGVECNEENIANGSYPYTVTYYATYRKGEKGQKAQKFLDWMQSEEGKACTRLAGYVPV